jgi:hypothetical protein
MRASAGRNRFQRSHASTTAIPRILTLPPAELPDENSWLADVGPGMSSEVLLQRVGRGGLAEAN